MKEIMIDCNCPWLECESHKGKLCEGKAITIKDCSCGHDHEGIGDQILGDGIHLCAECGNSCASLAMSKTGDVMDSLGPYIAIEIRSLEKFLQRHWHAQVERGISWVTMSEDLCAVLSLIGVILKASIDSKIVIPNRVLKDVSDYSYQVASMMNAFRPGAFDISKFYVHSKEGKISRAEAVDGNKF